MPSKKKKYNARFPAGRIKKIMQTDDEVGKVAQAVPVIISRTLELFVESLLTKAHEITSAKNAKTLSPSHMKQCILSESRFDFLKELVANVSDSVSCDYEDGNFPSVMSPTLSCNSSTEDGSSNRRSEKQSPVPASGKDHPATSTTLTASFYKESANASVTGSTSNNKLNSDIVPTGGSGYQVDDDDDDDEEIDEDYDTT